MFEEVHKAELYFKFVLIVNILKEQGEQNEFVCGKIPRMAGI